MLQKRREQFKRDIRRKQLDSIFREKRMELLEPLNFQAYVDSIQTSQLGGLVIHSLFSIERGIEYSDYQEIERLFDQLYKELKENAFEVSAYLIIKSEEICRMLKYIIETQQSSSGDVERRRLPIQLRREVILKFFRMFTLMNYRELREEFYLKLISNIWLIFVNKEVDIFRAENHVIFDELLKVLKKMLNSKSRIVLTNLKSIGLGAQLTNIIQFDYDYLTMDNQHNLVEIISSYLSLEQTFEEINNHKKSNAASILSMETAEKKVFMAFCLYLIDKRHEEAHYFALNSLVYIFQKFQFLISSFDFKNALQISQLIKSSHRKIQNKALQLIDDVIYKDSQKSAQFLQNCYLPDLLYDLLRHQAKRPSESTRQICIITSNIICNLTLCKTKTRQSFRNHPIWDFAYQNIQMTSPFLPMISVFEYFFEIVERKSALKFLESYMNGVGALEMNLLDRREYQAIQRTIRSVYSQFCDYWAESYVEKFRELVEQNHLGYLLEDLMDIEEEKRLNSL